MRQFYRRKSFKILVAAVIVLLLLLLHTALNGSVVLSNLFGLATPMQSVSAEATGAAQSAISDATRSREELLEENAALKAEIHQLQAQLSDYYEYQQENAELRNYLQLKTEHPDYQFVYGAVVARSGGSVCDSFRVAQGSLAGVALHDPVITEEGLVGWVSSVSAMYCQVTTIFSPETNVAAMDKVSQDTGVLTSDAKLADEGLVRLSYLDTKQTVQEGDMIVTSGVGGLYPKNLRIGKAVAVQSSETDVSLYATVRPYADIANVRNVMIITEFQGQGEAMTGDKEAQS